MVAVTLYRADGRRERLVFPKDVEGGGMALFLARWCLPSAGHLSPEPTVEDLPLPSMSPTPQESPAC